MNPETVWAGKTMEIIIMNNYFMVTLWAVKNDAKDFNGFRKFMALKKP